MDDHNPELPIALGLDGTPIYVGEGGDEYYGRGRYSDLGHLPDKTLDDCNALQLPDGGLVHFTTNPPPYVGGCHHGSFALSCKLNLAPSMHWHSALPAHWGVVMVNLCQH